MTGFDQSVLAMIGTAIVAALIGIPYLRYAGVRLERQLNADDRGRQTSADRSEEFAVFVAAAEDEDLAQPAAPHPTKNDNLTAKRVRNPNLSAPYVSTSKSDLDERTIAAFVTVAEDLDKLKEVQLQPLDVRTNTDIAHWYEMIKERYDVIKERELLTDTEQILELLKSDRLHTWEIKPGKATLFNSPVSGYPIQQRFFGGSHHTDIKPQTSRKAPTSKPRTAK